MHQSKQPAVRISPISNVKSLASILSLSEQELFEIAANVDQLWKPGKLLKKKSGEPRPTNDAREPLKTVHEHIKNRILKQVDYPLYMQGGIADPKNPRSCKSHAKVHSGKRVLIAEDIKDFFPSSNCAAVHGIWQYCFNFSPDVAQLLTTLTTHNGCLPQGWKTSGYLANLVFWDKEPELVLYLEQQGYSYSRFMDDLTVSSQTRMTQKHKTDVISSIYRMLYGKGFSPKRSKHEIVSANAPMRVTNLGVNGKQPTVPKKERQKVRTMVYQLEQRADSELNTVQYIKDWRSISGKVGRISSMHPSEGAGLRNRLRAVKPDPVFMNIMVINNSSKRKKKLA